MVIKNLAGITAIKTCIHQVVNVASKRSTAVMVRASAVVLALILGLSATSAEPLLYEAKALAENSKGLSVLIIDSRAEHDYLAGHIPGAVNLPVNNTFDEDNQFRVVGLAAIQTLFRKAGIESGKEIVVYDDGGFVDASRLFWVMEAYGVSRVRILNGGVLAWAEAGYKLSMLDATVARTGFVPRVNPDRVASVLKTKLAIQDENTLIIDSRPSIEYAGQESKSARNGHIPSAKNIPWNENFTRKNGRLYIKPLAELRELYRNVDAGRSMITYCNKGKQSSLTYFILRLLDYDVSHFDGSWYVWGNDLQLPVSK